MGWRSLRKSLHLRKCKLEQQSRDLPTGLLKGLRSVGSGYLSKTLVLFSRLGLCVLQETQAVEHLSWPNSPTPHVHLIYYYLMYQLTGNETCVMRSHRETMEQSTTNLPPSTLYLPLNDFSYVRNKFGFSHLHMSYM